MGLFRIITEEQYCEYLENRIVYVGFAILDEKTYVYFEVSPEERKKPHKQIEDELKMFLRGELYSYENITISFSKPIENEESK